MWAGVLPYPMLSPVKYATLFYAVGFIVLGIVVYVGQ